MITWRPPIKRGEAIAWNAYATSIGKRSLTREDKRIALQIIVKNAQSAELAKGGEGSGFFGHAGRPGEVGGSQAGGGIGIIPAEKLSDAQRGALLEEIERTWPDSEGRKSIARYAIEDISPRDTLITSVNDNDELVGVATVRFPAPEINAPYRVARGSYIATRETGYGRAMMKRVAALCVKHECSFEFQPTFSSQAYWRKLGMPDGILTLERARELAGEDEIVTKGGEGSGHWGHVGIPGHQGGSAPSGGLQDMPGADAIFQDEWEYRNAMQALAKVPVTTPKDVSIKLSKLGYKVKITETESFTSDVPTVSITTRGKYGQIKITRTATGWDVSGKNNEVNQYEAPALYKYLNSGEFSLFDLMYTLAPVREFSKSADLSKASSWESSLEQYKRALGKVYKDWYEQTTMQLEQAAPEDWDAILAAAILLLKAKFKKLMDEKLQEAFLEEAENEVSDEGWLAYQRMIDENDKLVEQNLLPVIGKIDIRKVVVVGALLALFAGLTYKVLSYAGRMWHALNLGAGEKVKRMGNPRTKWVLNDLAEHCEDCPRYAGEYDSWDDMIAQTNGGPGSGNTACFSNCRCRVEVWDGTSWQPINTMAKADIEKGGEGSGHFDHAGIPGHQGGSAPSGRRWVGNVFIDDSPVAWLIDMELKEANLPPMHTDGIFITFREGELIRAGAISAYGDYSLETGEIRLASNAENIHVIGGATVLHEIGHHVQLKKLTAAAAAEWEGISRNGIGAFISAYARNNRGEHFAEAYRAYARGKNYRAKLRVLEPASYKFMQSLFKTASIKLLPEGERVDSLESHRRYSE
ncbi:MAG: hypothetical protein M0R06_00990 [Sphaerochaeta sp.]|jgi:hypothetical protein|nr:hypothetical protein [Sphaerochaeta sp.]